MYHRRKVSAILGSFDIMASTHSYKWVGPPVNTHGQLTAKLENLWKMGKRKKKEKNEGKWGEKVLEARSETISAMSCSIETYNLK